MRIIITEGTQFEDAYQELSRQEIEVAPEMSVGELLKHAKNLPFQLLNAPYSKHIIDHLYLMHPKSRERLDESKTLLDYGLEDGSIVRLMSGVR